MIALETLAVFFAASVALGLAPGPDNVFVLTQSALHGRKAGVVVTVGLCSGLLLHTSAVALGVAAIIQASALAFNLLKWFGAAYLLYLAWQAFRAGGAPPGERGGPALTSCQLYVRGFFMNLFNPKVAIFFLAFLPQFADPDRGPVALQILLLGGVFIGATLLVFGGIAWTAGLVGERLRRSPRTQILLNRLAGTVFVALAARLVFIEQRS